MSEGQAQMALRYHLKGRPEKQFDSRCGSSSTSKGGIICQMKVIEYVLRPYCTVSAIQQAI